MAVYLFTAERSAGWWDTGEFIASAYKLQIVHQPGAPLFLMLQNVFSNFAGGDVERIAFWMNAGSAVCSGLTITFLFWTISALGRKCCGDAADRYTFPILLAATVGALTFSFTDTFWYSAVESEVYAMSSLCTAVVVWLALKWERRADEPGALRWLLAIAYVMGLSIGVHLLNLLTVPAIALWVYFRKSKTINSRGMAKTLFIGTLVLALILWGGYSKRFTWSGMGRAAVGKSIRFAIRVGYWCFYCGFAVDADLWNLSLPPGGKTDAECLFFRTKSGVFWIQFLQFVANPRADSDFIKQ